MSKRSRVYISWLLFFISVIGMSFVSIDLWQDVGSGDWDRLFRFRAILATALTAIFWIVFLVHLPKLFRGQAFE